MNNDPVEGRSLVKTKIVRSGSWWFGTDVIRATFRSWVHPNDRFGLLGFRIVRKEPKTNENIARR